MCVCKPRAHLTSVPFGRNDVQKMAAAVLLKSAANASNNNNTVTINRITAAISTTTNPMCNIMQQNQLTRSLERILEEAHISGELKLSGRKLKDFPKAAGKYNLNDTVIADLSRNRFCELPEDVTGLAFLETLFMYHNTLRSIPDSVRGLHSLSYLDLRSNQLSALPREICLLPLQVLLISNNRLTSLPDELGRMDLLTELDAASNQVTHLPARMSDLKSLRSLSLRNNQLVYLPKDVTSLQLVALDISGNRISVLPVELRNMTSLVTLELENNPLTTPPASLCVRGLIHVFKYLDTLSAKEERTKTGGSFDGHTTLRRTIAKQNSNSSSSETSTLKGQLHNRRQNVDSGYSTCDGLERRWSQELPATSDAAKWSPTPIHIRTVLSDQSHYMADASPASVTPATLSPTPPYQSSGCYENSALTMETPCELDSKQGFISNSHTNSNDDSPDGDYSPESQRSDEKLKSLGNVQTYREYKEALRQQRNQDSSSIYKPKDQSVDGSPDYKSSSSASSSSSSTPGESYPTNSPKIISSSLQTIAFKSPVHSEPSSPLKQIDGIGGGGGGIKKPMLKVTPSRNSHVTYQSPTHSNVNGNHKTVEITTTVTKEYSVYMKPASPTKSSSTVTGGGCYNNGLSRQNGNNNATAKPSRTVSWNRDIPTNEKLSFTMRREFDKQKEETELIEQLRKIIELRLKMSLPSDVASALTDGVVLCHLANQVRPRSVGSIHVPSAAVPKLTMARCRRNVDNFLNACRNIGVDEEWICSCADVVPSPDDPANGRSTNGPVVVENIPDPIALYRTVIALHEFALQQRCGADSTVAKDAIITATNTKTLDCVRIADDGNDPHDDNNADQTYMQMSYSTDATMHALALSNRNNNNTINNTYGNETGTWSINANGISAVGTVRKAPRSLDLNPKTKKRRLSRAKRAFAGGVQSDQLNEIIEECEYDGILAASCIHSSVDFKDTINEIMGPVNAFGSNGAHVGPIGQIRKRIEFFENNCDDNVMKNIDDKADIDQPVIIPKSLPISDESKDNKQISSILCLLMFMATVLFLYLFPIEN